MERKLAAILSADVEGYSRLVEDDDEAAIRTLTAHREVMRALIEAHHGRVVDTPGDNLLAEFPSVVDAVRCADELQRTLHTRNAQAEPSRRMAFRMGINIGDVIVEGDRIYGDGVNIAARLESLADAGGICLSGSALDQVENKLDLEFEFVGEQTVKNISKPIAVWRAKINYDDASSSGIAGNDERRGTPKRSARLGTLALGLGTVALIVGVSFWPRPPSVETVDKPRTAVHRAAPEFTERPAIIVLPFVNMSDDPEQEYFSDGITEDITTDLSKFDSIFVVSSATAFKYKGKAVDPAVLRDEFGIRYLLEGSVRKAGEQVRITARLIDVVEDRHLWGERYDRPLTDIFALQDEIRSKILTALRVKLTGEEQQRFRRAPTTSLEAYDFYLRAQVMRHRARRELRPEFMDEAEKLYEKAIMLDPDYAVAYGALGMTHWLRWLYDWNDDGDAAVERSAALYEKALALDGSNPNVIRFAIPARLQKRQYDLALAASEAYLKYSPKDPEAHRIAAYVLAFTGRVEEALQALEQATQLYPRLPPYAYWTFGVVYSLLGRDEEAIEILKRATLRAPNYLTNQMMLTIVYWNTGREDEARAQAKEILRISPEYKAEDFRKTMTFKDATITDSYVAALRSSGLP